MGIVQEFLHIIPTGVVTSNLDEFATGPPSLCATIGKARVCLLDIDKGMVQKLVQQVRSQLLLRAMLKVTW